MNGILRSPELNVATFAFLLNFPWEFLQSPLYKSMAVMPHWKAVQRCSLAALGDVVIMVLAYEGVALAVRSRRWFERSSLGRLSGFVAIGIIITVAAEWWALSRHAWDYAPSMPIVPLIKIGLSPLIQWIVLPPLSIWFVKRQIS